MHKKRACLDSAYAPPLTSALCAFRNGAVVNRPGVNSSNSELVDFVHEWIKLCASGKTKEAFELLDSPVDKTRHTWTPEDFHEVTFDHLDDGKYPVITDPDRVEGKIRKDVFTYDDGSGWGVEFDLPLNGVVSDFTLLFDFIKASEELKIILDDCHAM